MRTEYPANKKEKSYAGLKRCATTRSNFILVEVQIKDDGAYGCFMLDTVGDIGSIFETRKFNSETYREAYNAKTSSKPQGV